MSKSANNRARLIAHCVGAVAIPCILFGTTSFAEPTSQPAKTSETETLTELTPEPPPANDSIKQELIDAKTPHAGLLEHGPVSLIDPAWKDMNKSFDEVGLKVGFAYTALYQAASGGSGQRDAAGGDADLFGSWRLLGEKEGVNNGYVYFASEYRHDMGTGIAPGALGGQIGSLWGTTNGFGEQPVVLKEIYWQQHINTDKLILRIGKLDPENYYNNNYWQSDAKFFINKAFSSFPNRAFPGQGLGLNATLKLNDEWYITTGFQDAQGKKTEAGFDTFFDDFNLFSAFEVGYTPNLENLGKGNYRATIWYRDAGESDGKPHDSGFLLSFDQHINEHTIPFFRYGFADGNVTGVEHMLSGGVGWEGKMLTETDVVGIGGAWGKPEDHDLDDQYVTEVFYRMQVSPDNQFTLGYQVIFSPTFEPDDDVVGVFEVRWRITF